MSEKKEEEVDEEKEKEKARLEEEKAKLELEKKKISQGKFNDMFFGVFYFEKYFWL